MDIQKKHPISIVIEEKTGNNETIRDILLDTKNLEHYVLQIYGLKKEMLELIAVDDSHKQTFSLRNIMSYLDEVLKLSIDQIAHIFYADGNYRLAQKLYEQHIQTLSQKDSLEYLKKLRSVYDADMYMKEWVLKKLLLLLVSDQQYYHEIMYDLWRVYQLRGEHHKHSKILQDLATFIAGSIKDYKPDYAITVLSEYHQQLIDEGVMAGGEIESINEKIDHTLRILRDYAQEGGEKGRYFYQQGINHIYNGNTILAEQFMIEASQQNHHRTISSLLRLGDNLVNQKSYIAAFDYLKKAMNCINDSSPDLRFSSEEYLEVNYLAAECCYMVGGVSGLGYAEMYYKILMDFIDCEGTEELPRGDNEKLSILYCRYTLLRSINKHLISMRNSSIN